jgi:phage-related protein
MAIGFVDLTATNRIPDKSLRRATKPKVFRAAFGDGYEQRTAQGINNLDESYAITFNNREKAEIDDIVAFFDSKKGVTSFAFTYPDTNGVGGETTIRVVCEDYSIAYMNDSFYSCNAVFRRVYEP